MSSHPRPQLSHIGLYTDHQDEMRAFYENVLGMVVTDSGVAHKFKRRIVFMTGSPDQHHQFVLVARQPGDPVRGPLFQVSFKVSSLDEMRETRDRAMRFGATNFRPMNHGNSWSLYFSDPEQNTIEIYLDTPWYLPQPFADDLDLNLPDTEIEALTEARVRSVSGSCSAAQWSASVNQRLSQTSFK